MSNIDDDDLRPEYDLKALGKGVRGKYAQRMRAGSNIVRIEPDLHRQFPNEQAVNDALRELLRRRNDTARK